MELLDSFSSKHCSYIGKTSVKISSQKLKRFLNYVRRESKISILRKTRLKFKKNFLLQKHEKI